MKSTGIDLSNANSMTATSRLSRAQLKFFCSQFGAMDTQDRETSRQCSSEYASIIATRDRVCFDDGKVVAISDGASQKCTKPTKASAENCEAKNRAKVNGVCGAQLVQDCIQQKHANCDHIKVSLETCDHVNLLKPSGSACYERVQMVCAEQKNDGKYMPAINPLCIYSSIYTSSIRVFHPCTPPVHT